MTTEVEETSSDSEAAEAETEVASTASGDDYWKTEAQKAFKARDDAKKAAREAEDRAAKAEASTETEYTKTKLAKTEQERDEATAELARMRAELTHISILDGVMDGVPHSRRDTIDTLYRGLIEKGDLDRAPEDSKQAIAKARKLLERVAPDFFAKPKPAAERGFVSQSREAIENSSKSADELWRKQGIDPSRRF